MVGEGHEEVAQWGGMEVVVEEHEGEVAQWGGMEVVVERREEVVVVEELDEAVAEG